MVILKSKIFNGHKIETVLYSEGETPLFNKGRNIIVTANGGKQYGFRQRGEAMRFVLNGCPIVKPAEAKPEEPKPSEDKPKAKAKSKKKHK